jgi:carbonic anhydrase/acetyltransferase-like protein (isoleucine patch superfamily)
MPLYEFEGKRPLIHPTAWVAPSADIIGDVQVGPKCYVGWKAVLRGDHGSILIEEGSAVEEGVLIHTSAGFTSRMGPMATLGHGAIFHSATIDEYAVVGIGSTVCNYAKVGRWSIIGEAGLVKSRQDIPPEVIAVGQPVVILGPIRPEHRERWMKAKKAYIDFTVRNRRGLREVTLEESG